MLAIFRVKVTARVHMIKLRLFLLDLLNFWLFGNHTWSDDTSSSARVSCEKNRLLHSRSRSQRRVKTSVFIQIMSSNLPNTLRPTLVVWYIIMSWSVMPKDWFAIVKVTVTARAHMMKIWQFLLYFLNCWSFCYQTFLKIFFRYNSLS